MAWLVVLDPMDGLNEATDTSLAIIRTARKRNIEVDTATIEELYFEGQATVMATAGDGSRRSRLLDDYDLIFMRKEPPYDLAFHYSTQLLSLTSALVVNSPTSLRDFNEKLIALHFASFMPPTLVSSNPETVQDFLARHPKAVIKSLDSFQGKSVRQITAADREVIAEFTNNGKSPVMVQEFQEKVFDGDKRVMMVGDRLLGAALRKPKTGYHANFANSEALKTELSEREKAILAEVGPWMVKHGIYFSGLDFIGGFLTEINITCPTGIMQISALEGRSIPDEVVDYFLELLETHKAKR